MEAWTLHKTTIDKIETFEMWAYRRILKISWVKRIENIKVLRRMNKDREILKSIQIKKLQYLGHIMRSDEYQIVQTIMQGKIQGKRGRSWLKNLREWFNCSSIDLFPAAASKIRMAVLISNLLKKKEVVGRQSTDEFKLFHNLRRKEKASEYIMLV